MYIYVGVYSVGGLEFSCDFFVSLITTGCTFDLTLIMVCLCVRQELEETEREYETMMDERIRIVQKSVKKKPRKRRREEEEEEEDGK